MLCPYNYILSPNIRKLMEIDIKDKIIIFDEAHNLENIAESSCSLKLSLEDLLFTKKMKVHDPKF